jgi:hypothetical protein
MVILIWLDVDAGIDRQMSWNLASGPSVRSRKICRGRRWESRVCLALTVDSA